MHSWLPKQFPNKVRNGQCGPTCLLHPWKQLEPMFILSSSFPCPRTPSACCKTLHFCSFLFPGKSSTFSSAYLNYALPPRAWEAEPFLGPCASPTQASQHTERGLGGWFAECVREIFSNRKTHRPSSEGDRDAWLPQGPQ